MSDGQAPGGATGRVAGVDKARSEVPGGALSIIASRYQELQEETTLDLWVPGYEDLMKVRYRLLQETESDQKRTARQRIKGEGLSAEWEFEAQMLIDYCDSILVPSDDPESAEFQKLSDEHGTIRFDGKFIDLMAAVGIPVSGARARDIVLDFFSPRKVPGDPSSPRRAQNAMSRHVTAIVAWLAGEKDRIDRTLLGE